MFSLWPTISNHMCIHLRQRCWSSGTGTRLQFSRLRKFKMIFDAMRTMRIGLGAIVWRPDMQCKEYNDPLSQNICEMVATDLGESHTHLWLRIYDIIKRHNLLSIFENLGGGLDVALMCLKIVTLSSPHYRHEQSDMSVSQFMGLMSL